MNDEMLQQILQNQAVMGEQIKTLFKNQAEIKELTETVQKLAIALEKQGMALSSTEKKVDSVKSDVDEIKAKPAKRWDTIIAAIVTGIVGFLLAKFGLK
jgi:septation ring formation regulator EzrA